MQASAQAAWGAVAYRCGNPDGLETAATAVARVDLIPTSRSMEWHRYQHPALSYAILAVQAERFTDAELLWTASPERVRAPTPTTERAPGSDGVDRRPVPAGAAE